MIVENPDFHAHHSPMGAHSSFTLGMFDAEGGLGLQLGQSAKQDIYIGYRSASGQFTYLPFFKRKESEMARYVATDENSEPNVRLLGKTDITREYLWATDRFRADGLTLELITPFCSMPDPATAPDEALKFATCPVTFLCLTFNNETDEAWKGFFAIGSDNRWTPLHKSNGDSMRGFTTSENLGMATFDAASTFLDFDVEDALKCRHNKPDFLLGPTAGMYIDIEPGESQTMVIALGFFVKDNATFNRETKYWYTQYFPRIKDALHYALEHQDAYLQVAAKRDAELESQTHLNDEQKFLIAHATRSYYGSTELLSDGGSPLWVINEGEYQMMNTFDLTVDMLFFEMRFNPWTVRNVLEQYVERYRYYDEVFDPSDPSKLYPGGISFTHDMGVKNAFSPRGYSSYEIAGLDRLCFSYMTCEELTNWVLCAGVYFAKTSDRDFIIRHQGILVDCLNSLLNRDHPDHDKRNGLMSFESSRMLEGEPHKIAGEITTYDSLDHSLGQARENIYLGGKCWASYLALEHMLKQLGNDTNAEQAKLAAQRAAQTLTSGYDETLGYIPAVLVEGNTSAIIPAIEALVYPYEMGLVAATQEDGPYGEYIRTLKQHFANIHNKGMCLYEDGAWKLSSSADNSWMSKICLCQYVADTILGIDRDDAAAAADKAHGRWQREGSKASACSDQFTSGIARGSLYYPRIVTNILWMRW